MKKSLLTATIGLSLFSGSASADFVGVYLGAGVFNSEFSGDFRDEDRAASLDIDLEDDLGLEKEQGEYFYAAFEHPVPLIPNIRVARTQLEQDATSRINRQIEFNGQQFAANTVVKSSIDLSHTDGTLYYEFLDNWVNLDLGVTARRFDGKIELEADTGQTAQEELDYTIPLVYGKAQFDLPFTGTYISAEGNWIGYSGNSFLDSIIRIGYEAKLGLGFEAGVRTISVELDDQDGLTADLELSGVFVAARWHL